jgi:hypothetical protein
MVFSSEDYGVTDYYKFQITKHKNQMVRQAVRQAHGPEPSRRTHHLTTLSQVEGQITMTEIRNSKPVLVIEYLESSFLHKKGRSEATSINLQFAIFNSGSSG